MNICINDKSVKNPILRIFAVAFGFIVASLAVGLVGVLLLPLVASIVVIVLALVLLILALISVVFLIVGGASLVYAIIYLPFYLIKQIVKLF